MDLPCLLLQLVEKLDAFQQAAKRLLENHTVFCAIAEIKVS
jgi:cell fate (sporulation/competence/biofilm development) regulator YmcA (YheA/YmcA/DUF963 family)